MRTRRGYGRLGHRTKKRRSHGKQKRAEQVRKNEEHQAAISQFLSR